MQRELGTALILAILSHTADEAYIQATQGLLPHAASPHSVHKRSRSLCGAELKTADPRQNLPTSGGRRWQGNAV